MGVRRRRIGSGIEAGWGAEAVGLRGRDVGADLEVPEQLVDAAGGVVVEAGQVPAFTLIQSSGLHSRSTASL